MKEVLDGEVAIELYLILFIRKNESQGINSADDPKTHFWNYTLKIKKKTFLTMQYPLFP